MRLLDAEDFAGLGLGKAALLDEAVNLQGKAGLDLLALGIGKAEVSKNVAGAFLDRDSRWGRIKGST